MLHGRGRVEARSGPVSRSWCGCGSRRIWPRARHGSPRPWPTAARTPIDSARLRCDQVASPLRVRRLAEHRRRRRRRGRRGRRHHRPARVDQRAFRRLRSPHPGRPPARGGAVLSTRATRRPSSWRRRSRNDQRAIRIRSGGTGSSALVLAMSFGCRFFALADDGKTSAAPDAADAFELAVQPAGRASRRASRRLARRPAGQGGPGRPDRRDGRRRGDEIADLRPDPRGVLPDGRHA